jgi:hypothetical protein
MIVVLGTMVLERRNDFFPVLSNLRREDIRVHELLIR